MTKLNKTLAILLVGTKCNKKNVISAHQITDKGLKLLTCPPINLGSETAGGAQ